VGGVGGVGGVCGFCWVGRVVGGLVWGWGVVGGGSFLGVLRGLRFSFVRLEGFSAAELSRLVFSILSRGFPWSGGFALL